jgi:hypothetical protein
MRDDFKRIHSDRPGGAQHDQSARAANARLSALGVC